MHCSSYGKKQSPFSLVQLGLACNTIKIIKSNFFVIECTPNQYFPSKIKIQLNIVSNHLHEGKVGDRLIVTAMVLNNWFGSVHQTIGAVVYLITTNITYAIIISSHQNCCRASLTVTDLRYKIEKGPSAVKTKLYNCDRDCLTLSLHCQEKTRRT